MVMKWATRKVFIKASLSKLPMQFMPMIWKGVMWNVIRRLAICLAILRTHKGVGPRQLTVLSLKYVGKRPFSALRSTFFTPKRPF
jgi:hypothetical protein